MDTLDTLFFLAKVLTLSALISGLIKWVGPWLAIPPSAGISLLMVLTPAVLMALWLGWQWQQSLAPQQPSLDSKQQPSRKR